MTAITDGLDPATVRWVTVDGVATRYVDAGEGPTLVLLHGGEIGSLYSLDGWSLVLPRLRDRFRVIAPDRLGQGHTANPPTTPYRPSMMLDHLTGFLDAVGVRDAHIAGHSRGGLLGAWLALHRPDIVRTLSVVSSRSLSPEDPRYPNDVFYESLGHRQRLLAGEVTEETVAAEPLAQSYDPAGVTDDFIARMLEIARLPKSAEARHAIRVDRETSWLPEIYALRRDVLERVDAAGLPVPTQVVWGAVDLSAPLPTAVALFERLAARTPDVELRVLNRARHYVFRDRPAAFAGALLDFASRH